MKIIKGESATAGAQRVILEIIDENLDLLQNHSPTLDVAVHEARKNFKRLRAVMRLIRGAIDQKAYRRENIRFRDLSRQLAPLRDGAVFLETIDGVQINLDLPENALSSLRRVLETDYQTTRTQFLETPQHIQDVVKSLQKGREGAAALRFKKHGFAAISGGLRRVYRRGRRLMMTAYERGDDPHLFHDWRKRVKYLWHQLEILEELWPEIQVEYILTLKEISSFLGEANDLAVLKQTLNQPKFNRAEEKVILEPIINQRIPELWAAARPLGRRLYAETPASFVARQEAYWTAWMDF